MKLENSVVINRPVEEVFAFVSDYTNDDQYISGRLDTQITTPSPIGPGTRFDTTNKFLGRRIESSLEVSEYEPNRKICSRSVKSPVQFTDCRVFQPEGSGTRLTVTLETDGTGGLFKLADPIVAKLSKRQMETDLATLKDLLEARVPALS